MRILHVYKTFLPDSIGGLERAIEQIARATASASAEVRILSLSSGGSGVRRIGAYSEHVRYRRTLSLASNDVSLSLFARFGGELRWADLVHYHFPWPFADLLHLAWGRKKPSILTYHSDIVRQRKLLALYRPLMNGFLSSVDRIVATSPNYLATSPVLRRFRDKAHVVPIGLDPASYPGVDEQRVARWREEVGENFFLFVGVLRYYKGLHILLDAVANTDLRVLIVGAGPIERELRLRAEALGVRNVRFLGAVPDADKVALLKLSAGVVFPSHLRSEAFGVSLLEGAMYGKPMISSEIGTGTSFVNQDGETGLVIRPADPVALRDAMLRLQGDPALRERMGAAARSRFDGMFTADRMGQSYLAIYRQLLEDRRGYPSYKKATSASSN